jgi:hypothetical protein
MLQLLYRSVLRLHPPAFRGRFAEEMLAIFDQVQGTRPKFSLLMDGIVSLLRQWALRPEFWHEISRSSAVQPTTDGIPTFSTLDAFRPRTYAVINGMVLSVVLFCVTGFAIRYSWIHVLHVHIPRVVFEDQSSIQPNASPADFRGKAASSGRTPVLPVAPPTAPGAMFTSAHPPEVRVATDGTTPPAVDANTSTAQIGEASSLSTLTLTTIPANHLASYTGTYVSQSPNMTIVIAAEGGHLMMRVAGEPQRTLVPVSSTRFVVLDVEDSWIAFAHDSHGTIRQLELVQNGQSFTAQRQ